MIEANLLVKSHIIVYNVLLVFREIKGDACSLRMSEVNRMLGKVDELAVNTDTRSIPFNIEKQLRLLMVL
jgi:transcriptional antiterminator NusG